MIANSDTPVLIGDAFSGEWRHVAVTYDDPTRTVTTYLQGQPVTIPAGTVGSNPLALGTAMQIELIKLGFNRGTSSAWNGLVDEVHIFNRTLDADEVEAIFNNGCGTPPTP